MPRRHPFIVCCVALLSALFGTASTQAADAIPASLFAALNANKNGVSHIDGLELQVQHKSERWAPAWQRDLVPDAGFPLSTADSQTVQGTFKTDSGPYAFSQTLKQLDANTVSYQASLTGTPTQASRVLCLSILLPTDAYRGQKIFFDNEECDIPWYFKGQALLNSYKRVKAVRVPLKDDGTLVIQGDLEAYFQDNREYGAGAFDLQICFAPHTGTIQQANLSFSALRVPDGNALAVAYDPNAKKPARVKPAPPKPQHFVPDPAEIAASLARVRPLPELRPRGDDFVDAAGRPVRFWGMNLAAFYPEHALAEKTADNLASRGINIVRPHHVLRPSGDWEPSDLTSLLTYDGDSRTPNLKAWDHFDYFNARLREKGIYLSVTVHGTRSYLPEDGAILSISHEDDEAWADAMDDLNHWTWQKSFDPRKMLPVFDERCFLLNAEFARNFLSHVNPYTGISYAKDPQVVSVELINEFSSEYTLVCGNQFPDYWTNKLNALLKDYAVAHGVVPFTLYVNKTASQKKCFSEFCNSLDETYAHRMEKVIREAGYTGPIEFSNLWPGDPNLRMQAKTNGVIEDHAYDDPLVVKDPDRFLDNIAQSAVAGKPLMVGEFNQSESPQLQKARKPMLPMLPIAAAAYASLQDYSGIIWFAWAHGVFSLGPDGWGKGDPRDASNIGLIAGNGPILDHLRTAGIVYKNRYLDVSSAPQTIVVDDAYTPTNYNEIMGGQTAYQPGWQAIHEFRKSFGPIPAAQAKAPWLLAPPPSPTVSDTNQIVRDVNRQQLSFAAPKTEGFSGWLDGQAPAKLSVLQIPGDSGFASVIAVCLDDAPLAASKHILLSKTYSDADGKESTQLEVGLKGLQKGSWTMRITRPTAMDGAPLPVSIGPDGSLLLPVTGWNECELEWRP